MASSEDMQLVKRAIPDDTNRRVHRSIEASVAFLLLPLVCAVAYRYHKAHWAREKASSNGVLYALPNL